MDLVMTTRPVHRYPLRDDIPSRALWLSVGTAALGTGILLFRWPLKGYGGSPMLLFWTVVLPGWALSFCVSVFFAATPVPNKPKGHWRMFAPLAINVAAVSLWIVIPWDIANLRIVWWAKQGRYERIVDGVRSGRITVGQNGDVAVPRPERPALGPSEITANGTGPSASVTFVLHRPDLLDARGAFVVYDPTGSQKVEAGVCSEAARLKTQWYYIRSD